MLSLAIAFLTSSVVLDMSSERGLSPQSTRIPPLASWGMLPVVWYSQSCMVTRASSMLEWPPVRSRSSLRTSSSSANIVRLARRVSVVESSVFAHALGVVAFVGCRL